MTTVQESRATTPLGVPSVPPVTRVPWLELLASKRIPVTWFLSVGLAGRAVLWKDVVADPFQLNDPLSAIGLLLVFSGVLLRSWSASLLHKNHSLSTSGPYQICRHPLYLGTLLLLIGFGCAIHDLLTCLVLFGAYWVLYMPTIHREERRLADLHGEAWLAYRARTSMLLPLRIPTSLGPLSLHRWLANHEYRAVLGAVVGLLGAKVWSILAAIS